MNPMPPVFGLPIFCPANGCGGGGFGKPGQGGGGGFGGMEPGQGGSCGGASSYCTPGDSSSLPVAGGNTNPSAKWNPTGFCAAIDF